MIDQQECFVSFRAPTKLKVALDAQAAADGLSRSAFIVRALAQAVGLEGSVGNAAASASTLAAKLDRLERKLEGQVGRLEARVHALENVAEAAHSLHGLNRAEDHSASRPEPAASRSPSGPFSPGLSAPGT